MSAVSHIGIAGPIACEELRDLLNVPDQTFPMGYGGAPLMSVLIRELLSRGLRVSAFTTSSDLAAGDVFRAKGDGLELCVVSARRRAWRPNGLHPGRIVDCFAVERTLLTNEMRRVAPDVVHAHWTYEFSLAALASGLPTLVTCHDAPWEILRHTRSPYRFIRYLMARQVFRRAEHLTTVSPYMQTMIQPYTRKRVVVVPNPIAPYVLQASSCRDMPASRRVAMVCNGWDRRKNPEAGIKAFSKFRRDHSDAELHLFGTAFSPGQVGERWVGANGLQDGLVFHGQLQHRELIGRLQAMDVLLHSSLEESFGVVIAEAMALGLPVVAGRESGAVPWLVGLEDGCGAASLLCNVRDVADIASNLTRAFGDEYSRISRAGVERALDRYSPKSVAAAYIASYEGIG